MRPLPGIDDELLPRGEIVRVLYRLGRAGATGVLSLQSDCDSTEVLVLRRGHVITADADQTGRHAMVRLARLANASSVIARFDAGTHAYPPGAATRQLGLSAWVRRHLEAQCDATMANKMAAELAGVRLSLRPDQVPDLASCDETDRRIIEAMSQPRRLDQLWSAARTPRFRLMVFLHFLRSVCALSIEGIGATSRMASYTGASAALRTLGVPHDAEPSEIKKAYRRMARELHPDLHMHTDSDHRRELEARLAEVTAAYAELG